mmetsp:Transcript_12871/g.34087  ORF Transcript_12871/g.34087 Transcript_12871/m.34087 type:complete len:225 (-) Transcript_12871:887-1561(-)
MPFRSMSRSSTTSKLSEALSEFDASSSSKSRHMVDITPSTTPGRPAPAWLITLWTNIIQRRRNPRYPPFLPLLEAPLSENAKPRKRAGKNNADFSMLEVWGEVLGAADGGARDEPSVTMIASRQSRMWIWRATSLDSIARTSNPRIMSETLLVSCTDNGIEAGRTETRKLKNSEAVAAMTRCRSPKESDPSAFSIHPGLCSATLESSKTLPRMKATVLITMTLR